jgi:tetratricopeptide (TPR) repeat protein
MPFDQPHGVHGNRPERQSLTFLVRKDVKKHLEAGKRFFDDGQVDRAIERYIKALEADPNCALIHFNLGFAFHEEGNVAEARRNYERAVDLEPNCSLFMEHLARLHFELEEYHQAIDLFLQASMMGSMLPISYGLMGRAYFECGEYDLALEALSEMVESESNPSLVCVAKNYMVRSMIELGRLFEARSMGRQVLRNEETEMRVLVDLGEAFLRSRCIDEAREYFETVILRREEVMSARRRLREIDKIDRQIDEFLPQLFDADEERLLRYINVLMKVGSRRISQTLLSGFRSSISPLVREAVVEYHRHFGYEAFDELGAAENDEVSFVREKYVQYIADSRCQGKRRFMEKCLVSGSDNVRFHSVRYFHDLGGMDMLPVLESSCDRETDDRVKTALRNAISAIKHRGQEALNVMYAQTPQPVSEPGTSLKSRIFFILGILLTSYLVVHFIRLFLKGI